ncbi:MAG: glutamine amidotransferase, partial [Planctomycetota bacterium]|nr:glutamine amidotransferase [Planctomycetota bacterium]
CLIKPYAFGTHLRPTDDLAPEPADGRTDIGEALNTILEQRGGMPPRCAAVVLISDGRANRARGSPEAAARALAARGVRIHTVLVGCDAPADRIKDIAVRDLRAPARVFVGTRPQVRAVVATLGLAGKTFDAVLLLDGQEIKRRTFRPETNQTIQEAVFTPRAGATGLVRLALAVDPLEGELLTGNNRAETALRVDEGGIRVLYLDGRICPEGKFLARALGDAKEIELDRRLLLGGGAAAAPLPADIDAARVVVLGDLPAAALPPETVVRVVERIRAGSLGLLALGGLGAYGAGGWAETPLAGVLPFAIAAGDGQAPGPIRFRPAAGAAGHFIFSGDGAAGGAARFDALPTLSGANAVGALGPEALLLAESADGRPLLAVREFGRGRVAALTVDTMWQWALAADEMGGPETYRRFWRQMILWLAGRDGKPEADLWVMTDRPRYMISDPDNPPEVEITVHAGAGGVPAVEMSGPDGVAHKVTLSRSAGDWRAMAPLVRGGVYTLCAGATVGGAAKQTQTQFVGVEQDFEMANLLADAETMQRIARAGGGTLRRIERLGGLLAELAAGLEPRKVEVDREWPLASGRVFLGVVLAFLAAEWILRRRWALL